MYVNREEIQRKGEFFLSRKAKKENIKEKLYI